ncbi:trans-sulfuration enzyme family protein [Sphingobium sp. Z007]|nr:PLP-dependent transferase [Sphingobium sp. Z007]
MKDLTQVVHHPQVNEQGFASLAVPVYRASTIIFDSAQAYADRKDRGPDGYSYGLHGTPTTKMLEAQLSALERADHSVILPSGQAAIAILFLTILKAGDDVLIPDNVYPAVRGFCQDYLAPRGIGHRIYDPMIGAGIGDLIGPATRLIWTESPGSTSMEVGDLPAIAEVARARSVLTGCDNTWATPLLFKPLNIGMDFAMEALTKYVGGHSDLLLGSLSLRDRAWYERIRSTMRMLGIGVSPEDCALALRGIETMGVRISHIGGISTDFAHRLQSMPAVAKILHPALSDCPGHDHWKRDFSGASGVFSVVLAPDCDGALDQALGALHVFAIGASWGGSRSLIAPMSLAQARTVTPWPHVGRLLRISIGLEDPADLWDDLSRLLTALTPVGADG